MTGVDSRLVVRDMTVRYGGVTALDGVSLTAAAGHVTALIGPNGAGKSTMLGAISGLVAADGGRVIVGGRDLTGASPQAVFRNRVVRTFQAPQLVAGLTVREHVVLAYHAANTRLRLWRDVLGLGRVATTPSALRAADSVLERMGLGALADATVDALPMGLRRLVEVAQCLTTRPAVLLLDEPSAGLDETESDAFASVIADACVADDIAVLLVEHDLDLVLRLSSHIVVIDFGQYVDSGPPAHIRGSRAVQDAYIGGGAA